MKRWFRGVVLLFALIALFSSLPLNIFAADASNVEKIESSDVYDDLKIMGFDMSEFMKDDKPLVDDEKPHVSLIDFLEFGYDYYGRTNDYGLYLYVYNPSGRKIDTSSTYGYKNSVQLQVSLTNGEELGWSKYRLKLLDSCDKPGLENVFLKFKVEISSAFMGKPSKVNRHYELADIELIFEGQTQSESYGAGGRWSYSGYQAYHGVDMNSDKSTLQYSCNEFLTLELDINPATWKTETSDKGKDYRYELFSVYFSVPNSVIKKYGNPDDATKGLRAVEGVYSEYETNGIITPGTDLYNAVYEWIGRGCTKNETPFGFVTYWQGDDTWLYNYKYSYNGASFPLQMIEKYPEWEIAFLYGAYQGSIADYADSIKFRDAIVALREKEKVIGTLEGNFLQPFKVTTEDGDLKALLGNYVAALSAQSSWDKFWKDFLFNNALEDDIDLINNLNSPLICVPNNILSEVIFNDRTNAQALYVSNEDYNALESYVDKASLSNKSTFLMRYALRDYYCSDISVFRSGSGNDIGYGNGNYFFQKSIFLDFDILTLTWEDKHGGIKVIPVTAGPIDIVGSVTKPGVSVNDKNNGDNDPKGCADFLSSLSVISIVLGFILLYVLVRTFPGFFRFITAPIRWLFSGIGKLFGFAGTELKERGRERRAEKRDNRRAARDNDYDKDKKDRSLKNSEQSVKKTEKTDNKSFDTDDFWTAAEKRSMNELNKTKE